MTDSSITIRSARADDLDRIEALLEKNDLPTRDVRAKPGCFFVAAADEGERSDGPRTSSIHRRDGKRIGVGGIETYGSAGLLRSVVVEEPRRGDGYGTALCDALEARARERGVETLYLLTTTAAEFFRRRGYEEIERESAPAVVLETTEFADLCPSSATCMRTRLGG